MSIFNVRASLAVLALGICAASQAAPVVSYAPDQGSGDNISFALVADNFSLGAAYNINNIRFWSIQSAAADYSGSVYWSIYSDLLGAPGSVLFSGTPTISAVATGLFTGFGYAEYSLDIPVAFQLAAGDYWLALHNGALSDTGAVEMLWETSSAGNAPSGRYDDLTDSPNQGWLDTGNEHAFRLDGDRVVPSDIPEPATLALVICGLYAARSMRRLPKNT